MAEDRYNGWKNYPTWNVVLWLDNEESAYRYYVERVRLNLARNRRITGKMAKAIAFNAFGSDRTGDGVSLRNSRICWPEIARSMKESAE